MLEERWIKLSKILNLERSDVCVCAFSKYFGHNINLYFVACQGLVLSVEQQTLNIQILDLFI